jgi:hypothetical protein
MAIGRISGPMLLPELDRQGINLDFVSGVASLFKINAEAYSMQILGGSGNGLYRFDVAGNLVAGNVVIENGALITTQQINQPLILQANGVANVTVINANVISGRVDGTVVGGLDPRPGTFTYLNANVLGTFATANINNLSSNRVPFTAANNNILIDNPTLRFFNANNALVVANLSVLEQQTFTTLDAGNLIIREAVPTAVTFIAANNWVISNAAFNYSNSNNLVSTGNIRLTGVNTNQLLYLDGSDERKFKGSPFLQFDGINMTANGISTMGNVVLRFDVGTNKPRITTAGANEDLVITPSGTGSIDVDNNLIRNLASPLTGSDAATKQYVDSLIVISSSSDRSIFQFDSSVIVSDDNLTTANIVFTINGVEQGRVESSKWTVQDLVIRNNVLETDAGALEIKPFSNDRVIFDTSLSMRLPQGNIAQRPSPGSEQTGDFRFNSDLSTIEWYDGNSWENPANSTVTSQTIVPDGANVAYTLNQTSTTESVLVNFNGVIQRPSTTYAVSGDVITFTTVPLQTDVIEVRFLNGATALATNPIYVDKPFSNVGVVTTTVDQWSILQYIGAKYTYTARTSVGNNVEMGELRVVHDNSLVANALAVSTFFTSSFVSKSGNSCVAWSTIVSATGVVSLRATGTHADMNIKFHATYFTDPDII